MNRLCAKFSRTYNLLLNKDIEWVLQAFGDFELKTFVAMVKPRRIKLILYFKRNVVETD